MAKLFRIIIVLMSLTLIQCSSDESNTTDSSLTVNGSEFKLGSNTGSITYNMIKSQSELSVWLTIREKSENGRVISVYAMHESPNGSATGTYSLRNDMMIGGVAAPTLYGAEDNQLAGGSNESQPTGTISINDLGGNHYIVTFNNVVLDPGTASETTITGTCNKTFNFAAGN